MLLLRAGRVALRLRWSDSRYRQDEKNQMYDLCSWFYSNQIRICMRVGGRSQRNGDWPEILFLQCWRDAAAEGCEGFLASDGVQQRAHVTRMTRQWD